MTCYLFPQNLPWPTMTVRDLKTVLDSLPADCIDLPVRLEVAGNVQLAVMILIDPPGNFAQTDPKVTLTDSAVFQQYPDQMAATFARVA